MQLPEPFVIVENDTSCMHSLSVNPFDKLVVWTLRTEYSDGTRFEEELQLNYHECEQVAGFLRHTLKEKGLDTFDLKPLQGGAFLISTVVDANNIYLNPEGGFGITLGWSDANALQQMLQALTRQKDVASAADLQPVFGL